MTHSEVHSCFLLGEYLRTTVHADTVGQPLITPNRLDLHFPAVPRCVYVYRRNVRVPQRNWRRKGASRVAPMLSLR